MFLRIKSHILKRCSIFNYICSPALKCLSPKKAAGKQGCGEGVPATTVPATADRAPGLQVQEMDASVKLICSLLRKTTFKDNAKQKHPRQSPNSVSKKPAFFSPISPGPAASPNHRERTPAQGSPSLRTQTARGAWHSCSLKPSR